MSVQLCWLCGMGWLPILLVSGPCEISSWFCLVRLFVCFVFDGVKCFNFLGHTTLKLGRETAELPGHGVCISLIAEMTEQPGSGERS